MIEWRPLQSCYVREGNGRGERLPGTVQHVSPCGRYAKVTVGKKVRTVATIDLLTHTPGNRYQTPAQREAEPGRKPPAGGNPNWKRRGR